MTAIEDRYFEEIEVGETGSAEHIRTITEADILDFAGVADDFHPQHVSRNFESADPDVDDRIAHGNLIFSIVAAATGVNAQAISYGYDGLRFVRPVKIGDTLSIYEEVTAVEEYDDERGRVVKQYEARNQDNETVLVAEHILLVNKRPS
ncbi:MAG: MaoC family dehydratase [Salinirussus sp.]